MAAAAALYFPDEPERESVDAGPIEQRLPTQEKRSRESRADRAPNGGFVYDGVAAGRAVRAGLSRRAAGGRPLPMEDVAFFIKDVDNSGLRRQADPSARAAWLRMISGGGLVLLFLIVCFGPRAWLRHSGYRQAVLIEQRDELRKTQRTLQVESEQLTDLRRVEEMARAQGLSAPGPDRVDWQNLTIEPVDDDRALAQNFLEAR